MKILESYKKIAKSMLTEHAWDRKFGEPLVTLKDVMNEAEDDKYVSIGFGRFKLKGQEDKEDAEVFVKTKDGKYVSSADQSSDDKGADTEEPEGDDTKDLGKGMNPDDFERDFDDDSEFGKDYTRKFMGTDEPEDDEDAKAAAFADMEDEFGDEDEWDESVKVINGKKYKKVKEHAWDRKFGEPLPTLTDVMKVKEDKKVTEKHILRENYERFGGK